MNTWKQITIGAATIVAAGLSLACALADSASAQTIDMRKEYYEGRWDWKGVLKATQDANNFARIQFNTPTQAVYCYHNRKCSNVKVTKQPAGGDLTFSTDGKNYFELNPAGTTQINGRFWLHFKPPARSPDATIVFARKP